MSHRSPRSSWIGSKVAFTIVSNLEAWASFRYCKVYNACLVCRRFDREKAAIFTQIYCTVVGTEAELLLVESVVLKYVSRP